MTEFERPSDEFVARLYADKLLELQKIAYEIMRSRGVELRSWEKPWDVEP